MAQEQPGSAENVLHLQFEDVVVAEDPAVKLTGFHVDERLEISRGSGRGDGHIRSPLVAKASQSRSKAWPQYAEAS